MLISVVIPALNEARRIERTIQHVLMQEGPFEIIVSDGGSTDATVERARQHVTVIEGPRGRAVQMNRGAAFATGKVLLFLHADTLLPTGGLAAIRRVIASLEAEAGAFRLQFDVDSPLLRFYSWCTRFRWSRICFGDRGLFMTRAAFDHIGGFPDTPLFEDLEMVRLLHARVPFCYLPLQVTTAARRFNENGALRQQLRNAYLWSHYLAGTDPHQLIHLYGYEPAEPDL